MHRPSIRLTILLRPLSKQNCDYLEPKSSLARIAAEEETVSLSKWECLKASCSCDPWCWGIKQLVTTAVN